MKKIKMEKLLEVSSILMAIITVISSLLSMTHI
ncbi:MAG: DUF4044 domain-containing protein [Clostridia bacterium]|nr:DUF4044 domain-containing protein [Clostridia bacterium]